MSEEGKQPPPLAANLLRDVRWSFSYQERYVRLYYAAGQIEAAADD